MKERGKNKTSFKRTSDAPSLHRVQRSIDTLFELHKGNKRKGDVKWESGREGRSGSELEEREQ